MQYFKNADLTKMYPVSEKAVRNWISAAQEGKLELALYEKGDKTYIANTSQNAAVIDKLVAERKKYVNTRGRKTVKPTPEFYDTFNTTQTLDIINNLETYGEIPLKYSYFNKGAEYWDKYAQKLAKENTPNMLNQSIEVLDINTSYLFNILKDFTKVNIVDVGPGNGLPLRRFLSQLQETGKLGRYIALDVSSRMLEIVESSMKDWFGEDFPFEGHVKDISRDHFTDVLGEDVLGANKEKVCNLVFLFGGITSNFRAPDDGWRVIHNSIGQNDYVLSFIKLDSDSAKRYFDFNIDQSVKSLSPRHQLVLEKLNIDRSMYDVEQFFDEETNRRIIQVRLNVALTIEFGFSDSRYDLQFNKGDTIIVFQYWHQTAYDAMQQLDANEFSLLQSSQSDNHEYILTISKVRGKQ